MKWLTAPESASEAAPALASPSVSLQLVLGIVFLAGFGVILWRSFRNTGGADD